MTERIVIEAEPREVIGKKVGALRRSGWIPAVIYGRQEPNHVQVEARALRRALRVVGTTQLADVQVGPRVHTVIVREIQQHPTRGDLVHIDFMEVDMKSTLRAEAELVAIGEAPPETDGQGVATLALRSVEIECLPDALVSTIDVDMSRIQTGDDVIYVRDITPPNGVEILTDADTVVARFEFAKMEDEVEEEVDQFFETDAEEVEVIGRGKGEEDEEEF